MQITVRTPAASELKPVLATLASWQQQGLPVQLHPGDLGWQWRLGADRVAASLRVWSRGEETIAIGVVDLDVPSDGAALIRMALAPTCDLDDAVARALVRDLVDISLVEARFGSAFRSLLEAQGWLPDEAWTPLHRDLTAPVAGSGLRIETVGPLHVEDRVAVQLASFATSTFTAERWRTMAAGVAYEQGRCLVGYDQDDNAVAALTVWSAGPGRAGLLEPVGVHRDHRGHGYGTAITMAAAEALREMGSSSATVATPTSNIGGVATYVAAGFVAGTPVTDFRRPGAGR